MQFMKISTGHQCTYATLGELGFFSLFLGMKKIVYCDACMTGLAFWFLAWQQGFYSQVILNLASKIIFYFEALAVAEALDNLCTSAIKSSKIIVYSDNMNTVNIFNSLHCLSSFNPLLCFCVDIFLEKEFNVCIVHISDVQNTVVDVISHQEFERAAKSVLELYISSFQPSQFRMLGAAKK
jgi:hypothetical protein